MMERKPKSDLESTLVVRSKKFVRYQEGADLYSLGLHTFQEIAKDAGAIYRIKRVCLVNLDIIDEYMENFREE
jgi:hypothetical protein